MIVYPKLSRHEGDFLNDVQGYRSIVGAIQYICHTRPDISFSVNKVVQYMQSPTDTHWLAVKRILKYLQGTLNFWFHFTAANFSPTLQAFSDVD
ncbi:cysteine-rich RLK (RECEPTOR-like protein kinase) 8 [Hibiscus trionum]|uniref:Cysteine-rich RLK (RECEPTOR-like protein kinase) 8 n=1 Tax=Hibiscus trionum TaxID=183268 RepID=A0A9W7J125_HIBTR|nr:cysteine-rich RLK (RECEPTOR-like protein kinase) 8 [Hibiscus trionum]